MSHGRIPDHHVTTTMHCIGAYFASVSHRWDNAAAERCELTAVYDTRGSEPSWEFLHIVVGGDTVKLTKEGYLEQLKLLGQPVQEVLHLESCGLARQAAPALSQEPVCMTQSGKTPGGFWDYIWLLGSVSWQFIIKPVLQLVWAVVTVFPIQKGIPPRKDGGAQLDPDEIERQWLPEEHQALGAQDKP